MGGQSRLQGGGKGPPSEKGEGYSVSPTHPCASPRMQSCAANTHQVSLQTELGPTLIFAPKDTTGLIFRDVLFFRVPQSTCIHLFMYQDYTDLCTKVYIYSNTVKTSPEHSRDFKPPIPA